MANFVNFGRFCSQLTPRFLKNTTPTTACCRCISSSTLTRNQKVFEVRTYTIKPPEVKAFMDLSDEWLHLRTSHSKLIGYWTSEIGGINEVFHVWEYDSLSHRAVVRLALAQDKLWIGNYFSKILPMVTKQDNRLMLLAPGSELLNPPVATGVYEVNEFDFDDKTDVAAVSSRLQERHKEGATLLGSFYSIIGSPGGMQLWYHPSIDNVIQEQVTGTQIEGLKTRNSRLLMPTTWSPMK